ncbi:MAG: N-acetylmuramoyl-L-alanine amidase [Synergistaceae bacterium]|nr:N-acetylmuramoyl-L-alanine amidase [Synergistaceae bacterium]
MKILIDPGHGIPHAGAKGRILGVEERVVTLRMGHVLKSYLEGKGFIAYLTRSTDLCLVKSDRVSDLRARGVMAGRIGADLMLSLHCNSVADPRANGYEGYTLPGQDQSDVLADSLLKSYGAAFPHIRLRSDLRDGDLDKEMDLRVLHSAPPRLPKVLFELAFLSNPQEEAFLGNSDNYPAIAAALGQGIMNWAGRQ